MVLTENGSVTTQNPLAGWISDGSGHCADRPSAFVRVALLESLASLARLSRWESRTDINDAATWTFRSKWPLSPQMQTQLKLMRMESNPKPKG
jgi:hypothetical protein